MMKIQPVFIERHSIMSMSVNFILANSQAKVPHTQTPGSAGYDLYSCEEVILPARGKMTVDTGVILVFPDTMCVRVVARSGLASKHGITVGAELCDSDYQGTIRVILFNCSDTDYHIHVGDRIAQAVFSPIYKPVLVQIEKLEGTTERGAGGFGSTGY